MPNIKLSADCPEEAQVYPSILGRDVVVTKGGIDVAALSDSQRERLVAMGVVVVDAEAKPKRTKQEGDTDANR